jgi:hypothetical protein
MFAKNVFAIKHIKEAKQRLDLLIQKEARKTMAQTPGRVDHLENTFIEGERAHSTWSLLCIEASSDGDALTDSVRNVPGTFCCRQRASSASD